MSVPRISVVIPALNEEANVEHAIASVHDEAAEIVVVDGGSFDRTVERAMRAGADVRHAVGGRGAQLADGAAAAAGDWLVFLHADTQLEPGWSEALFALPADVAGGAFRLAINSPRSVYRVIEAGVSVRCALFKLPYGDQAIFARRAAYQACGGFPPLPLMEDVAFVHRLRRVGRLAFPDRCAFTSPRRWEEHGVAATTLSNLWRLAQYTAGRSPQRLAETYLRRA